MESKNIKHFISLALIICLVAFIGLSELTSNADAESLTYEETTKVRLSKMVETYELLTPTKVIDNKLLAFVAVETGLDYETCQFLIDRCKESGIDLFLMLGLMQNESKFNVDATGKLGEIGLSQLMEITARHYSQVKGYSFTREAAYVPMRNIDLAIEHLSYLAKEVGDDTHGILTAYNRGLGGMQAYVRDGRSPYEQASMSDYSISVVDKMDAFKEKFNSFDI